MVWRARSHQCLFVGRFFCTVHYLLQADEGVPLLHLHGHDHGEDGDLQRDLPPVEAPLHVRGLWGFSFGKMREMFCILRTCINLNFAKVQIRILRFFTNCNSALKKNNFTKCICKFIRKLHLFFKALTLFVLFDNLRCPTN